MRAVSFPLSATLRGRSTTGPLPVGGRPRRATGRGGTRRFGITRRTTDRGDTVDTTTADLAERFAIALTTGSVATLRPLLADEVVASAPGLDEPVRLRRGVEDVLDGLFAPPADGVQIRSVDTAELLGARERAFVVIAVEVEQDGVIAAYETAFHLQCRADRIVGITEYSGDPTTERRVTRVSP